MATTKGKGGTGRVKPLRDKAQKKGDGKRSHKVADALRGELMTMLLAGEVHDPAVVNVVVSGVEITDDLRLAKVFVRLVDVDAPEKSQKALIDGLFRARGFLRRELAQRLDLRYAPDLRFFWDASIDRGREMESLLREIKRDDEPG